MDPLSITASIISVLQATNAVISICYDYSSSLKQSNWQLPKVIEEVKGLRNVLETLEPLVKTAESTTPGPGNRLPTLKLLCSPDTRRGLLFDCLEELNLLKDKLSPPSWAGPDGSKTRALVLAMGWPLKEGDTKKALDNIGRYKATLALAITADQATLLMAIQNTVSSVQNDLTKLNQLFSSMKIDDYQENVHRWLAAPDPSVNHNEARKRRQERTGLWFIGSKGFENWKIAPGSMLWLHGIPGCGKSILTSTIIEDVLGYCHLNPGMAAAYFYFDFSDTSKQRLEYMIRSLLTQLSIQYGSTPNSLRTLYDSCRSGVQQPTIKVLIVTLRHLIQEFQQTFIILDALDECRDRPEFLEIIEEIHGWKIGSLHLLVTSRREMDIECSLDPLLNDQEIISLQSALVDEDIRAYVRERLQTDRSLRRWRNHREVQNDIEMALVSKAGGMFRWAACQLDELGKCLNLPMLRKALGSLPKTLDDTYARILNGIDEDYSQYAITILQWLVYSVRPLQIEELAEAVAVDLQSRPRFSVDRRFPEPRDVAAICSSLVTMLVEEFPARRRLKKEAPRTMVRLAHFSVREYLTSERILAGPGPTARYSIREIPANLSIAKICLAYLLQFDRPDSTYLSSKAFPLAQYAACYWNYHTEVSGEKGGVDMTALLEMEAELFMAKPDAAHSWARLWWWSVVNANLEGPTGFEMFSSLQIAVRSGRTKIAKLLIEQAPAVDASRKVIRSLLQLAVTRGHRFNFRTILEAEVHSLGSAFAVACTSEMIQQLLREADAGPLPEKELPLCYFLRHIAGTPSNHVSVNSAGC